MAKYYPERDFGALATLGGGATYVSNTPGNVVSRRYIRGSHRRFITKARHAHLDAFFQTDLGKVLRGLSALTERGNVTHGDKVVSRMRAFFTPKEIKAFESKMHRAYKQRRIARAHLGKKAMLGGLITLGFSKLLRKNKDDLN